MNAALLRAERVLQFPGAVLVCDIDGTVAADVARRHLRPVPAPHCLEGVPAAKIEQYMAPDLVSLDAPIEGAAGLLSSLLVAAGCPQVVMVTARWNTLRDTTSRWLESHYPWLQPRLLMRTRGDVRPSVDVKLELVLASRQCRYGGVWIDDDPAMLTAAGRHGFFPLKAPDIYQTVQAVNTNAIPHGQGSRRDREFLHREDPRARLLAATAPARIPVGSVLCLCGPDETCLLCSETNEEHTET